MTRKLTTRKHVHASPRRIAMPTESHSDGQHGGYFSRTLQTLLLALRYSEPLLFIGTLRLLRGNSYLWCVHVIYERPMTDHICRIRQVVEASTSWWTFEASMRKAAWEALAIQWHEASERMEHSQYRHFSSRAKKELKLWWCPQEITTTLGASLIKWS
jgi:hypothetical protein